MNPSMTETFQPPALPARKVSKRWFILGLLALTAVILAGLWWWNNRPIQPVMLSAQEKVVVEEKMEAIQKPSVQAPAEPKYEKGSKEIVLTERELNGLLNENTALGKSVKFELATNAIHARVETDLDPDLPIFGGRKFKARARFLVSDVPGQASFILDDVTVWGVSLPNDWLAGLKGRDLLGEVLAGGNSQSGKLPGVEEFKVEAGQLKIRLAE
jgi:hypothetical protein